MSERAVARVVTQTDGLREGLIEAEIARQGAADLGHLEGVGEAGDEMIPVGIHEHLRLVFQAAECLRMQDAVAISLALLGHVDALHVQCAWVYAGLRIAHSLVQATVDVVMVRFSLFILSWAALGVMVVRGAIGVF